jgi:hypothetical protein
MNYELYEVLQEYQLKMEGLEYPIKARIIQSIRQLGQHIPIRYYWQISHYYKPKDAPLDYTPNRMHALTKDDAYRDLMSYMKGFTLNVTANKNY